MKTEKLFYADPFMKEFTAGVLHCEQGKGGWEVVLDRTAFYPEGGGQPADHGVLGTAKVLDVHEKDGVIVHLCDAQLPPGAVCGRIDWERRFDHMQQHSGEHICSGILCSRFHCDNVGFHMGAETVTIDYNADISWEQLMEVEQDANRYICENHAIDIHFYRGRELDAIDYRSKKPLEGDVRIVSFPGADCCACCGTHVPMSGQVGVVKFLSCQRFRDGVRLELLCGGRASRYLAKIWEQDAACGKLLSVKPTDTASAVERLQNELGELKLQYAKLEEASFARRAETYSGAGSVLLFEDAMPPDSVRKLCCAIANRCGGRCAVFAGSGENWKYAMAENGGDLRELTKKLNAALTGRGGGKPFFVQGSAHAPRSAVEAFFAD